MEKFSWGLFLELSKALRDGKLKTDGLALASERTAVSRAYYSAFHAASEFYDRFPHPDSYYDLGSHERVLLFFEKDNPYPNDIEFLFSFTLIYLPLSRLKKARTHADYKLDYNKNLLTMPTCIEEAEFIIEKLGSLTELLIPGTSRLKPRQ